MFTSFPSSPFLKFIRKRSGPFDGEVTLDSSRVYILPTRTGLTFGVLLLVLLIGSVNYEKSLGYALTFLLVGIGNVAILSTWKNLKGLHVSSAGCVPVFAGESAEFRIRCVAPDKVQRYSISMHHAEREHATVDIDAEAGGVLSLFVESSARGMLKAGPCKIATEFPFGLFIAWTWVDLNMSCLVYPAPAERAPETVFSGEDSGEDGQGADGQDHFDGLRSFHPGDSYKRVSWKSFARNSELMVKQYSGGSPQQSWIDWSAIPVDDVEDKLSIMCRLLLDADEQGVSIGLKLPGRVIESDTGAAHRNNCLRALALYGVDTDAD